MTTIEAHRSDLDELARLAEVDLDALLSIAGGLDPEVLAQILTELIAVYGSAAGTLAADWYDEMREEARVVGRFTARTAALPQPEQVRSLAGYATSLATPDDASPALNAALGGMQRLITNVSRDTIIGSSLEDPQADGWMRSASGGCGFCRMLASRGAVYSATTVDFGAHDNCRCVAVPAFRGRPRPVQPFTPTERTVTDDDRRRTLRWMRKHGYLD